MLLKLFAYLSDGRAPLVEVLSYFVLQNLLPVFLPCTLKIKAKLLKNWSIFHFLKYSFDHTCILKLRMINEANLMLFKLIFENQQHCDPLTPQTLDKFISEREIFVFFVNAAESGKGGVHHLS